MIIFERKLKSDMDNVLSKHKYKSSVFIVTKDWETSKELQKNGFRSYPHFHVNGDKPIGSLSNIEEVFLYDSLNYNIQKTELQWKLAQSKAKKVTIYENYLTHLVLFSGGLGSYFTAKRLLEQGISKDDIILLFTDTKIEDEDLYRFISDAEKSLGISITNFSDGRDIWQVFKDVRFLGNSRLDPCSRVLKREMSRKFIKQFSPDEVIIYLGYDYTEMHRFEKAQKAWLPYKIESPLCDKPYIDKQDMIKLIEEDGIKLPRLYKMGFSHNNCGGGCVKAGIGHFTMLLDVMPERFKEWEDNEQMMRDYIGKDVSILRRTRKGVRSNFTLRQLREERETITKEELCDIGGCGCFSGTDNE